MNPSARIEIIAEIHPQHGGDMGVVREMIRQAAGEGADVAKFQLYNAFELLGSHDWDYLQLDREQTERIAGWCGTEGIEFMASVFDPERLEWCEAIGVRRHKIASRTVAADPGLCGRILATGKETFVSLGAWTGATHPFPEATHARYLHCVAKYPAFAEDLAGFPPDFPAAGLTGYSDHTLGIDAPLLAISRGASVIEKHFTLDKTRGSRTERAHVCSMTPSELRELRRFGDGLLRVRRAVTGA
jgi:N,N'-diacetyllegionaminate synthase